MFVLVPSANVWNLNNCCVVLTSSKNCEVINGVFAWSYPSTNELVNTEAAEPVINDKSSVPAPELSWYVSK